MTSFHRKSAGKYAVYISGTWAIASLAGPVLGGVIAEKLHWSLIFWINLPLAALAVFMTERTLAKLPWTKREHKLDWLGAFLVVSATVSLMLALTFGGKGEGWTSPPVLALFAAAIVLACLFAFQLTRAAEPLIPLAVLSNPVVKMGTLSVFFAMAAFIGMSIYVPLYLELVLGLSATYAGFALVGYMVGTVFGANLAARVMARVAHYKQVPVIGLAVGAAGLAYLAWRAPSLGFWEFELLIILIGIGCGTQFPVTTVAVQNAVEVRDLGTATGVLAFLRSLGSSIGVAVLGAVATASGIVVTSGEHGATAATHTLDGLAFRPVFLAAMLSIVLGFVCMLFMEERPLRGREPAARPAAAE